MREEEEVEVEEKEEVVEEEEKGRIESHFPSTGKDSTEKVEDGQGLSTFYPPVPPNCGKTRAQARPAPQIGAFVRTATNLPFCSQSTHTKAKRRVLATH